MLLQTGCASIIFCGSGLKPSNNSTIDIVKVTKKGQITSDRSQREQPMVKLDTLQKIGRSNVQILADARGRKIKNGHRFLEVTNPENFVKKMRVVKATRFFVAFERGEGDSVKEIKRF